MLSFFLSFLPLLLPLFTRLRREDLLKNPVRARLFARIEAQPGVHLRALDAHAGVGSGAVRHHLGQLVRHGLVREARVGARLRYWPAEGAPREETPPAEALRDARLRAVHDLLSREPGLSVRRAAERLGMSPSSLQRARVRLRHEGLLPPAEPPEAGGERAASCRTPDGAAGGCEGAARDGVRRK